ncbi:MAG: Mur ligase family protein [Pseudomonadota bacterium]
MSFLSKLIRKGHLYYKRNVLRNVRWVAITGSVGKSTTSALISAVLSCRGQVVDGTVVSRSNTDELVDHTVLAVGRQHRYCVIELSIGPRLREIAQFLRPHVGVVTNIASDHRSKYKSLENIARVKSEVIRALGDDGVAILNADDPLVWGMRGLAPGKVIGFGRSPSATLQVESATGEWPNRMTVQLKHGARTLDVKTRFLGDYAALPVAAALAVGLAQGIRLEDGAAAIAAVEPVEGRLRPSETSDGVMFIDNSWKTPYHILPNVFQLLSQAKAKRKIIVLGSISDYPGSTSSRYRSVARQALKVADLVVFVGRWGGSLAKLQEATESGRLLTFIDTRSARDGLRMILRHGDLVLLQGSQRRDHLERILLDRLQTVSCWRADCGRLQRCLQCPMFEQSGEPHFAEI